MHAVSLNMAHGLRDLVWNGGHEPAPQDLSRARRNFIEGDLCEISMKTTSQARSLPV